MVNEASVSEPCGLRVAHPGCAEEVNNSRSRNFLFITRPLYKIPAIANKIPADHTNAHTFPNRSSPPTSIPVCVHVQLQLL